MQAQQQLQPAEFSLEANGGDSRSRGCSPRSRIAEARPDVETDSARRCACHCAGNARGTGEPHGQPARQRHRRTPARDAPAARCGTARALCKPRCGRSQCPTLAFRKLAERVRSGAARVAWRLEEAGQIVLRLARSSRGHFDHPRGPGHAAAGTSRFITLTDRPRRLERYVEDRQRGYRLRLEPGLPRHCAAHLARCRRGSLAPAALWRLRSARPPKATTVDSRYAPLAARSASVARAAGVATAARIFMARYLARKQSSGACRMSWTAMRSRPAIADG